MTNQPGLDDRHRDKDGEIRHKNPTTKISTLRETYGKDFAPGYDDDDTLGYLLKKEGVDTLSKYIEKTKKK